MAQTKLPSLRALAAFDAVAQFESFSRGADHLGVTHGAVSRQIRLLEESLNTKLFIRGGAGTSLTNQGQILFVYTRKAFISLQQGMGALENKQPTSLRISVDISLASQWLISKLHSFKSQYPSIPVYLHTEDEIIDLNISPVDVAIRYGRGDWPNVYVEELLQERLIAVASPMLLEKHNISNDPTSLLQFPLLQDDFHQDCWSAWADAAGIDYKLLPKPELAAAHTGVLVAAAISGQGVALVRQLLAQGDLAAGRLVRVSDIDVSPNRCLYFVCRTQDQHIEIISAFRDWIKRTLGT